ncbi:MAG: wax ester/triacylglycerol synthase family O-acyltransferase [Moraxella sp.]|nr:wax ester/triacylglycerol synthase family O-acyltransferase [Moraxella sp.]
MRPLSAVDLLFLLLESKKQPMHVAGLCLFELPKSDDGNFIRKLITQIKSGKSAPSFPFNQVLKNGIFWDTDKTFDINHHFRHHTLSTGSDDELMAYISHQHSIKLDRSRPLWQLHLIDGLSAQSADSPKRFAIYLKVHHAMADGIAAMRLLEHSLADSPNEPFKLPFWSLSTKYRSQIDVALPIHKPITHIIKEQLGTIRPVMREIVRDIRHRRRPHIISTFDAPSSILNQRISHERTLMAQSFDKHRFLAVAKHHSVTTNDVILAVCAGALQDYLSQQNALPDEPLIAFVPISLRQDDSSLGNQLSFLLTNLATHEPDLIARLHTITHSINQGKRRFFRMNQAQIINYSALNYGWAGINLATGLYPTKQAFNLIISNVPSRNMPLYLNGAKLTGIFPASVLFDGQALNITLTNHQDTLDFGITACRTALPDIKQLPSLIEQHLSAYEQSIQP